MKHYISRILVGVVMLGATLAAHAAGERLFHVSRSLNRNIVVYDVHLSGNGLDTKTPVNAYWRVRETPPEHSKELNLVERKLAYGIKVKKASPSEAQVTLAAYSARPITVRQRGGKWVALITIGGRECQLTEVYVKAKGAMNAEYIELRGKSLADGSSVKERIKN